MSLYLEGHADERGTREYNLALGFRRAQSVQEYLVARGVSGLRPKDPQLRQGAAGGNLQL